MAQDLPELSKEEVCWISYERLVSYNQDTINTNNPFFILIFQVEEIVELYKEIFQPAIRIVSATVKPSPKDGLYFITSQWSQRSLERGSSVQIMRTLLTDSSFSSGIEVNAVDVSHWFVTCYLSFPFYETIYNLYSNFRVLHAQSNSGKLKAVIHAISSDDSKIKKKYFLEVWSDEKLIHSFDLSALNLHGPVYTDGIINCYLICKSLPFLKFSIAYRNVWYFELDEKWRQDRLYRWKKTTENCSVLPTKSKNRLEGGPKRRSCGTVFL